MQIMRYKCTNCKESVLKRVNDKGWENSSVSSQSFDYLSFLDKRGNLLNFPTKCTIFTSKKC